MHQIIFTFAIILPLYLMWTIMSMCVWTLINMVRLFLPLGILIEKKVKSNHKKINFTFFKKYMRAWIAIYALQQHTFHKALHEVSWREALQSCIFQKWNWSYSLTECQMPNKSSLADIHHESTAVFRSADTVLLFVRPARSLVVHDSDQLFYLGLSLW